MAPFKIEFATVRELEKKTYRIFGYGGAAIGGGLILTIAGLAIVGAPIMGISLAGVAAAMMYVTKLGKEPSRHLFCPYCASQNDVFVSKMAFSCDICKRPVVINEIGEPVMAEPIDTTARYNY